jgi:hypothetical protein
VSVLRGTEVAGCPPDGAEETASTGNRRRGPYVAETLAISVEDDYLVIEL